MRGTVLKHSVLCGKGSEGIPGKVFFTETDANEYGIDFLI